MTGVDVAEFFCPMHWWLSAVWHRQDAVSRLTALLLASFVLLSDSIVVLEITWIHFHGQYSFCLGLFSGDSEIAVCCMCAWPVPTNGHIEEKVHNAAQQKRHHCDLYPRLSLCPYFYGSSWFTTEWDMRWSISRCFVSVCFHSLLVSSALQWYISANLLKCAPVGHDWSSTADLYKSRQFASVSVSFFCCVFGGSENLGLLRTLKKEDGWRA